MSVLKQVVELFNLGTIQSSYLWDILTALRGPDNDDSALKHRTTALIRSAIGMTQKPPIGAIVVRGVLKQFGPENPFPDAPFHFIQHYNNAVHALEQLAAKGEIVLPKENVEAR